MATRANKPTAGFLGNFRKEVSKLGSTITESSEPPRYWYSTGNYVFNRIISGSYRRGIPQGRVTILGGLSGAGKSYLAMNLVKQAQQRGAIILVVDSENALDDEFASKIGVDPEDENYFYFSVVTIDDALAVINKFIKGYKAEFGDDVNAPEVLILLDSLTMLMTATEWENHQKGINKGGQGQKQKQLKSMLTGFVQDIKFLNIAVVATTQVYKNQDPIMNPVGPLIVSDSIQYACSQIITLSKRRMKGTDGKFNGVRIIADGFKTRFTLPFQKVELDVPYTTGMDPLSGLIEAAKGAGVIKQGGAWYSYSFEGQDYKFQAKGLEEHAENLITLLEQSDAALGEQIKLEDAIDSEEVDVEPDNESTED